MNGMILQKGLLVCKSHKQPNLGEQRHKICQRK